MLKNDLAPMPSHLSAIPEWIQSTRQADSEYVLYLPCKKFKLDRSSGYIWFGPEFSAP